MLINGLMGKGMKQKLLSFQILKESLKLFIVFKVGAQDVIVKDFQI
jgi:hypothetical protein